jgi:hypothetical protein
LAGLGNGTHEVVESEERLEEVTEQIHRRIANPVLTGLRLEADGFELDADSLVPRQLPDLFVGNALCIWGRYRGAPQGALVVQARDGEGKPWFATVAARRSHNPAIAPLWARGRVPALEDQFAIAQTGRELIEKQLLETSLRFGVLCRFTSFVAVDRAQVVNPGGLLKPLTQAVEMPAGWSTPAPASAQAPVPARPAHRSGPSPAAAPCMTPAPPLPMQESTLSLALSEKIIKECNEVLESGRIGLYELSEHGIREHGIRGEECKEFLMRASREGRSLTEAEKQSLRDFFGIREPLGMSPCPITPELVAPAGESQFELPEPRRAAAPAWLPEPITASSRNWPYWLWFILLALALALGGILWYIWS